MTIWEAIEQGKITRPQMTYILTHCLGKYAGKKITSTTVIARMDSPETVSFREALPLVAKDILDGEYKPAGDEKK